LTNLENIIQFFYSVKSIYLRNEKYIKKKN
jgi:hypothetical protein